MNNIIRLMVVSILLASIASCTTIQNQINPPKPVPAGFTGECVAVPNTQAQVCHYRTIAVPVRTLWYFPGLLESANVLQQSYFDESGFQALISSLGPIDVVLIGYGNGYYLRPPGTAGTPTLKEVRDVVIPYVEKTYGVAKPYIALGMSEGGANAAEVEMLLPDLFSKVILANPVILDPAIDPFNFVQWCPACLLVTTNFYPSEWLIASPMLMLSRSTKIPQTLVLACKTDNFSLYKGPQAYVATAKSKGFDITFADEPDGCTHFGWSNPPILDFLK